MRVDLILKRTCGVLKFRNPLLEYHKQRSKQGRQYQESSVVKRMMSNQLCHVCLKEKANEQVCVSLSRSKLGKIKAVAWDFICPSCKSEALDAWEAAQ